MSTNLKHVIWWSAFLITLVVASRYVKAEGRKCFMYSTSDVLHCDGEDLRVLPHSEPSGTHGELRFIEEPSFLIGKMVPVEDIKTTTIEKLKEGLKCPEGFEIVTSTRLGVARCLPKEDLPTKNEIIFNRCDCEEEK